MALLLMNEFETYLKTACHELTAPPCPKNLAEAISYSLLAPGKRVRPRLLLATAQMLGLEQALAFPMGAAIEMIHCFTLIHDDLPCMDDDDFRRGRPSNHKTFGEALALLAGDALVPMAFELANRVQGKNVDAKLKALNRLIQASGPQGVIGGQAKEMLLTSSSDSTQIIEVHRAKTGALFNASVLISMDLAGITEDSNAGKVLAEFSENFGRSFQILDDLDDAQDPLSADPIHLNILGTSSREKALKWVEKSLSASIESLNQSFGSPSQPLIEMANELLSRSKKIN